MNTNYKEVVAFPATAQYRLAKNNTVVWYCLRHANRLTSEFWANGDPNFVVRCCKCGVVITAGGAQL